MELPKRKEIRLRCYDYSKNGAYFLTFCTIHRQCILWSRPVGATIGRPSPKPCLTALGQVVEEAILEIPRHYPGVSVEQYAIMPNHVHLLLLIDLPDDGRPMVAPTISRIMAQLKGVASKRFGAAVWQKGYYDHVIRDEMDFLRIWQYIDNNPARWLEDKYYIEA